MGTDRNMGTESRWAHGLLSIQAYHLDRNRQARESLSHVHLRQIE